MSELAMSGEASSGGAFDRSTTLIIVIIGVLAFSAMLVLGAYAPELGSGRNGGAHALSKAATGYSGLVQLAEETGRSPSVARNVREYDTEDLVVLTPEDAATSLTEVLQIRGSKATLLILPKWETEADDQRPGWVKVHGLLPEMEPEGVLAPATKLDVLRRRSGKEPLTTVAPHAPTDLRFRAPIVSQAIKPGNLEPLVTDGSGRILVGKVPGRTLYVASDADLLNNHGMADPINARAALALLDFLNSTDAEGIVFDVTLNGLGSTRSPLRLAFDPPFLAVTMSILAALLLAGIQALRRFGAPRRLDRALPFGKAALVDNSAALVRKARRELRLTDRYVDAVRERAAATLRLPLSLKAEALTERLDKLPTKRRFSDLADQVRDADSAQGLLAGARALHQWQQEI